MPRTAAEYCRAAIERGLVQPHGGRWCVRRGRRIRIFHVNTVRKLIAQGVVEWTGGRLRTTGRPQ